MIAALWSNSNWDEEKGTHRKNALGGLEREYEEAIATIEAQLSGQDSREEEGELANDPFFAASQRGVERVLKRFGHTPTGSTESEDADNFDPGIDQQ